MKVLITGGAGFIGSHIVDGCVAASQDVTVVDDLSTGDLARVNPKAAFRKVDIRSAELDKVIAEEKPEIVCHQAARANVRESMEAPLLYADVNVLGSLNLLECCRKHGVRKVVYASTGGAAYGEPQHLPVAEDHPVNPLDPYGASKHHVEHYLFLYRHNFGLDYTILRYPNVFGERQDPAGEAGVVAIFGRQMLLGQQPVINGSGLQERDFVHVSDVVKANLLAFDRASGRILNIGSGVGTSVNEIYQVLVGLTGFQGEPVHGPERQGEVNRIFLDARRARSELGWSPSMPLEEGLRQTVNFLKAECEKTLSAPSVP